MRAISVAGALFMALSAALPWTAGPVSGRISFLEIEWIAFAIGMISTGTIWVFGVPALSAALGITGLGLCSFSLLSLAFMDSPFWFLVDENAQYAKMIEFSTRYLPLNEGGQPTFQPTLLTDGVAHRLASAVYFLGSGWWICLGGSLVVLLSCMATGERRILRWAMISFLIFVVPQGGIVWKGILAEYVQEKGNWDMVEGRLLEAIQRYQDAQQLDPQLAKSERLHLLIGEASNTRGTRPDPHARFYTATRLIRQNALEAGISELELAAREAATPLKEIIHTRLAWTYVEQGRVNYRKGFIGPAADLWKRALEIDPQQIQAAYFLTRAYFDQGRYEESIAMGRLVLSRSRNPLLNADVQANMGDSYWAQGKYADARTAYEASMRLDSDANFRVIKSLGGT